MTEKMKILNHLQSREDEMVELLETFVNIDSPSTYGPSHSSAYWKGLMSQN